MYFFRHWNSPKSCQHFKGEVEYRRGSTGGVTDIQGKTQARVLGEETVNPSSSYMGCVCLNISSLFLEKSLQLTPLFFVPLSEGKMFKKQPRVGLIFPCRIYLSLVLLGLPLMTEFSKLMLIQITTVDESLGSLFTIQMLFCFINFTFQFFLS